MAIVAGNVRNLLADMARLYGFDLAYQGQSFKLMGGPAQASYELDPRPSSRLGPAWLRSAQAQACACL
jgi:hypothetical protein